MIIASTDDSGHLPKLELKLSTKYHLRLLNLKTRKKASRMVITKPAIELLVEFELYEKLKKRALSNYTTENKELLLALKRGMDEYLLYTLKHERERYEVIKKLFKESQRDKELLKALVNQNTDFCNIINDRRLLHNLDREILIKSALACSSVKKNNSEEKESVKKINLHIEMSHEFYDELHDFLKKKGYILQRREKEGILILLEFGLSEESHEELEKNKEEMIELSSEYAMKTYFTSENYQANFEFVKGLNYHLNFNRGLKKELKRMNLCEAVPVDEWDKWDDEYVECLYQKYVFKK